jgi:hypothetical protein
MFGLELILLLLFVFEVLGARREVGMAAGVTLVL